MSFLGGIARSLVNPATLAQIAMGPAGWASIAMEAVISAVGQQVIQQLGEKLGLPQSVINMAQTAFARASGTQGGPTTVRDMGAELGRQFNLSPSQQGNLERASQQDIDTIVGSMMTSQEAKDRKLSGGKSWLMAIAQTLGDKTNARATDFENRAGRLGGNAQSKENLEYAAKSQKFSMLFTAANTATKTIGEALQNAARKQ